jgi:hypothetical protein
MHRRRLIRAWCRRDGARRATARERLRRGAVLRHDTGGRPPARRRRTIGPATAVSQMAGLSLGRRPGRSRRRPRWPTGQPRHHASAARDGCVRRGRRDARQPGPGRPWRTGIGRPIDCQNGGPVTLLAGHAAGPGRAPPRPAQLLPAPAHSSPAAGLYAPVARAHPPVLPTRGRCSHRPT